MTTPSFRAVVALLAAQLTLLLCRSAYAAKKSTGSNGPAITFAPSEEELLSSAEASSFAERRRDYAKDVAAGRERAYVVVLRGKDFGTDESRLSVRINGAPATDVLLHNSTAFSFRIPTHMVLDKKLFDTSYVEINVGPAQRRKIPLSVLERAFTKVEIDEYREHIVRRREALLDRESSLHERESDVVKLEDGTGDDHEDDLSDDGASAKEEPSVVHNDNIDDATDSTHEQEDEREQEWDARLSEAEKLLAEGEHADTKVALRMLEEAIERGSVHAMTVYGTALLSGTVAGLRRDISRAVGLLRTASDQGFPDAQAMLGFVYASGIAGDVLPKNVGAALLMWSFAAEAGSMYAKMALGYRYFTGTDIQEDCEKASEYYKDVADEVFKEAREAMDRQAGRKRNRRDEDDDDSLAEIRPPTPSSMLTSNRKRLTEGITQRVMGEANELVQYYRHSADRGDPTAQVIMGNLYYYGAMDMPQDIERARELFSLAATKGRTEAHAHLGFMHLRAGRNESAVYHLKKAAEGKEKLGYHGMGFVSLHGIGVKKDARLAAEYFEKAIAMDHPEAMFNLAIMYLNGVGVSQSSKDAFRFFQAAARFGHMQSNYYVGVMLLRGVSPASKDCTMATPYLKLVAQQGVWNNILSKAYRAYERGSYAHALFRYLLAAHAGIELAQYNAAFMYERNTLTNRNGLSITSWGLRDVELGKQYADRNAVVEDALELYQMSASQGHSDSMVRMGDLAFGEAKDFGRAASAYERAVKQRNAEAMFNLGWMHARGFGMNPDKHMAKRYFDQAKETEPDAVIPATIALYSLKYSESMFAGVDKMSSVLERMWFSSVRPRAVEDLGNFEIQLGLIDVVTLSVLLCVLILVVIARQKRLVASNRRRNGREAVELDGAANRGEANAVDEHPHRE